MAVPLPFETSTRRALRELVDALDALPGWSPPALVAARAELAATYLQARGYVLTDESRFSNPFPFILHFRTPERGEYWNLSRHATREAWEKAARAHDRRLIKESGQ